MTFPTVPIDTNDVDADTDSPLQARQDLLDAIQKLNQIIAHVSLFAATFLDDADGAAVRVTIGAAAAASAAFLNVEDQALTGGVIVTSKDLGTISSGTVTPDPGDRPQQHYTNNGAHTLGVSANAGSILVDITNGVSAGAITTSGFTKVAGDLFTTTNGHKFRCHISIGNGGSLLSVQALQ